MHGYSYKKPSVFSWLVSMSENNHENLNYVQASCRAVKFDIELGSIE